VQNTATPLLPGSIYGLTNNLVAGNVAVGYNSLANITSGVSNTACGYLAGNALTTGHDNTACGYYSLNKLTNGYNNMAYGSNTLYSLLTGTDNVAIGTNSLNNLTTGYYNVACGTSSLANLTTGTNNTAIGYQSLQSLKYGANNTAYGYTSSSNLSTGINNCSYGSGSLFTNTTGNNNTAIGYQSLQYLRIGNNNTVCGYNNTPNQSAGYNYTMNNAIFLGTNNITSNTVSTGITIIGNNNTTAYDNNILIGNNMTGAQSNELAIDPTIVQQRWSPNFNSTTSAAYPLLINSSGVVNKGFYPFNQPVLCSYTNKIASPVTGSGYYIFNSLITDTTSSYSQTTGLFTIPVTGYYRITFTVNITSSSLTIDQSIAIYYSQNNTSLAYNTIPISLLSVVNVSFALTCIAQLTGGTGLTIGLRNITSSIISTLLLQPGSSFSIELISY
jgi:hypothetical protein